MDSPLRPRVSHERRILGVLRAALEDLPDVSFMEGQGAKNRFQIADWTLPLLQHFQFGDLRAESDDAILIIEAESAGGVTNLAKYWPHLAAGRPEKRFVLAHLFLISSEGDYMAHRRLWEFLVTRMREDLEIRNGLRWPDEWEARLFTYESDEEPSDLITFARMTLGGRRLA